MFQYFKKNRYYGAMEAETISKNAARLKSHTSRGNFYSKCGIVIVIVIGLIMLFINSCVTPTRVPPVNPFAFLKGQQMLHVVMTYEDVLLQGVPERNYLQVEQPQWVEHWEEAKYTLFIDNFMGHLNNNLRIRCGNYPNARFQATVFVLSVDRKGPGRHLEGPGIREVTCEVVFTRTGDSYPLATLYAKGTSQGKTTFTGSKTANSVAGILAAAGGNAQLAGKAFGYMGQDLGKQIAAKIK